MPVIRVAHVVRPAAGGMRRHVEALLASLDRSEFVPALFAPPGFRLRGAGVEAEEPPFPIGPRTSALRDLRAILALGRRLRGRFDLVHAHGLRGALVGVPAARLAGIPALFTAHNLVPPCGGLTAKVLQFLGRSATVIAVSQAAAATLSARGIEAARITVIPNGVDLRPFADPGRDEAARREFLAGLFGELDDAPQPINSAWLRDPSHLAERLQVIVGIGRLAPEKGFDTLISAMSLPGEFHLGAPVEPLPLLILAGTGPEEHRLRATAARVPNVRLIGAIEDVVPLLTAADIVAVPSREEGQGLVALEAMAARRPVVGARVGGLTETILDGETGLLVPPDDPATLAAALGFLARSPDLCVQMANAGRKRVEQNYTLDLMMERLSAVYRASAHHGAKA